jgi:hypothetical protein
MPPDERQALGNAGRAYYENHMSAAHAADKMERLLMSAGD